MNYAIIAVGVVLTYSLGTWFIPGPKPFNARKWFTGERGSGRPVGAGGATLTQLTTGLLSFPADRAQHPRA